MSCDPARPAPVNPPRRAPIVEDAGLVGGTDATTGAPVIRPKTTAGKADESTIPTDPREKADD